MLLWDLEMVTERQLLGELTPQERLEVGVAALAWTLETLAEPIETVEIRDYLARGVGVAQRSVSRRAIQAELPPEMVEQFDEIDGVADEPGTSHFLAALMACHDVDSGLDQERISGVLSYCYEGSLDREGLAEWSPDVERRNQRCLDVIQFQRASYGTS